MADKLSFMNLEENTARAMCYIPVFGVLAGVVFLVMEKNKKVRWDAVQAILVWVLVMAADYLLGVSVILRWFVPMVNLVGVIVIPLLLAVKASQKEETRLPFVGEITDKIIK